jgi:hypothetical protein
MARWSSAARSGSGIGRKKTTTGSTDTKDVERGKGGFFFFNWADMWVQSTSAYSQLDSSLIHYF